MPPPSRTATAVRIAVLAIALCAPQGAPAQVPGAPSPPARPDGVRLVLQITVDGLRGDVPTRFRHRFGKGGFRRLFERGTHYAWAHHPHADTETGPGHATLVTGATPTQHGIVAGEWWDYEKGGVVYAVEDSRFPVLEGRGSEVAATSTTLGRSPQNLLSSTIGDEIHLASERRARVFAVAVKDRSAILPAGFTGKAFWLSRGRFVTSAYYYDALPDWVRAWNDKGVAESYRGRAWTLREPPYTYDRVDDDDRPYEMLWKHLGTTFPHPWDAETDEDFYRGLEFTPAADELLLSFVRALILDRRLGRGAVPDYLSVSFASLDYAGHLWGPGSLEAEDALLRIDRTLATLLDLVDREVGLRRTLVVLSSDHGSMETPEYLEDLRFPAGRTDPETFVAGINGALRERFGGRRNLVATFVWPYLYLDVDEIRSRKLDLETVERAAAEAAMEYPSVAYATTRSDLLQGRLPAGQPQLERIRDTFHPRRAGHVHLVGKQFHLVVHPPWHRFPGMHGSLWSYDTYVPIFVMGPGVPAKRRVTRPVGPQDVAPTIAVHLGIKPPSGSVGRPLSEVVDR